MIKLLRFNLVVVLLIFGSISNIAEASFGASCAAVPAVINETDTINTKTTAYGNLQNYIKPPAADLCNDTNPNFITFNLRTNWSLTSTVQVQLPNGYSGTVAQAFAGLSDIATDSIMGKVNLSVQGYNNNTLCLFMPTTFGDAPVFCKNVSYVQTPKEIRDRVCSVAATSCYDDANVYSMSPFNFTGKAYHCLTESLNKIFYLNTAVCTSTDGVNLSFLNPFVNFQNALRNSVGAALVLYVIFFGIKILLGEVDMKTSSFITFVMKVILVAYFAVGLGPISYTQGNKNQQNGVVTWGLPLLSTMVGNFSSIIFNATGAKGLCNFDPAKYREGHGNYAIWDAIDCRLGYYLGLKMLSGLDDTITEHPRVDSYNPNNADIIDITDNSSAGPPLLKSKTVLSVFPTLFGFITSGDVIVFAMLFVFVVVLVSILIGFFSSILVCVVTLYGMLYIAPIFVPMALFDRTKGYFDSWLRITIGVVLQPAIFIGFLALMLSIYDDAIYNNCEFVRETYAVPSINQETTYDMNIYRIAAPTIDRESCISSPGVKLMKHSMGFGWRKQSVLIMEIYYIAGSALGPQLAYLIILTFILYQFAKSVHEFASELSGGPDVGSVSVSVGALMTAIKFAVVTVVTKGQNIKEKAQEKAKQVVDKARQMKGGE